MIYFRCCLVTAMNFRKEVQKKLGKENVSLLYYEARRGRINPEQLKNIAQLMHGNVLGVYEANKDKNCVYVLQDMLDCWYNEVLCDDKVDGVNMMKEILDDPLVGLHHLSNKLTWLTYELPNDPGIREGIFECPKKRQLWGWLFLLNCPFLNVDQNKKN